MSKTLKALQWHPAGGDGMTPQERTDYARDLRDLAETIDAGERPDESHIGMLNRLADDLDPEPDEPDPLEDYDQMAKDGEI